MDDMILKLAKAIKDAGGTLYLVGGCVRDKVLNKKPKDIDVAIHGLPENQLLPVLESFGKVKKQGKSFPIYIIKVILKLRFLELIAMLKKKGNCYLQTHLLGVKKHLDEEICR